MDRWRRVLALLLALVVLGAACSSGGGSDEATGADPDGPATGDVGDKVNEDVDTEDVRPGVEVVAYEELIPAAIEDIQVFWEAELPAAFGQDYLFVPEANQVPYSSEEPPPSCGGQELSYEEMANNAFWCYPDDYMAWDDEGLFPDLYREYGPFAVAMVLAHEWGHGVQDQIEYEDATIIMEQQADCFAGAWAAHELATDSALGFRTADLEIALGGMLKFRDQPGTTSEDPSAHGSGFDRINAFQEGFELGTDRCAEYAVDPPTQVDLVFLDESDFESGGNLPYDDAIELASRDLNDYWTELNSSFVPVEEIIPYDPATERVPDCGGTQLSEEDGTYVVLFCFEENYVIWDDVMMRTVHENIGDFGVATLLGLTWTQAAQKQLGLPEDFVASQDGSFQQACFTGAWAGRLMVPDDTRQISALSPGDLDEAIQAFLSFAETPDERGRTTLGSAFERSQAFRVGFFDGAESCDAFGG